MMTYHMCLRKLGDNCEFFEIEEIKFQIIVPGGTGH